MQLLTEARPLIARLSGDRIRHEINHILASSFSVQILARLDHLEMLRAIHPNLEWDEWLYDRMMKIGISKPQKAWGLMVGDNWRSFRTELGYILWLIRLTEDKTRSIVKRLKMPASLANIIFEARRLWETRAYLAKSSPSCFTMRFDSVSPFARYAFYISSEDPTLVEKIEKYITNWQYILPNTDGNDLKRLGIPPGPIYREILLNLRKAWLDGEISSDEEESTLLTQLIAKIRSCLKEE